MQDDKACTHLIDGVLSGKQRNENGCMGGEKSKCEVAEPSVVLHRLFEGHINQSQDGGASGHREKQQG